MKIQLKQLVNSIESLKVLFNKEIPIVVGYEISQIIEEVENHLKHFDEVRNTLVKKIGEKQEDDSYIIPEKSKVVFSEQVEALLLKEINIKGMSINISSFGDITMKPVDLSLLSWLITK